MAKKEKFSFTNPDGTPRICKVIERLPDGTRVFEGGWTAGPSTGTMPDGTEKKLIDMTPEEYEEWNTRLMERLGREMTEFYNRKAMGMRC